jgi:hypothetical protein
LPLDVGFGAAGIVVVTTRPEEHLRRPRPTGVLEIDVISGGR